MTGENAVFQRAIALICERLERLEGAIANGDESAWPAYYDALKTLIAINGHLTPGSRGELLTTRQMADRLNITPTSLLRRKAGGTIRPALQAGKLVRWRGDEMPA